MAAAAPLSRISLPVALPFLRLSAPALVVVVEEFAIVLVRLSVVKGTIKASKEHFLVGGALLGKKREREKTDQNQLSVA